MLISIQDGSDNIYYGQRNAKSLGLFFKTNSRWEETEM